MGPNINGYGYTDGSTVASGLKKQQSWQGF